MKFFKPVLLTLCAVCFLCHTPAYSQRCATVEYNNNLQSIHPSQETRQQFEEWMQNKIKNGTMRVFDNGVTSLEPYQIPVVVHIIHNGEAIGTGTNLSTQQIKSQIAVLNADFNRMNADASKTPGVFLPFAGSLNIQFVLARQDENGKATNGITRTKGTKATWDALSTTDDANLKALNYWAAEDYFNIWVTDLANGYLGYTQFPETNKVSGLPSPPLNRLTDGVVIDYMAFGVGSQYNLSSSYNLGRTTTHEVGHFFGLRHIWGDGSGCQTDYVDDTPFQYETDNTCPTHPQASCDVPAKPYKMFQNYMDYTLDACMNLFTNNQADRMRIIIENSPRRVSLLTSHGLVVPPGFINDVAITEVISPGLVHCIAKPVITFNLKNSSSLPLESFQIQTSLNGGAIVTQSFTNQSVETGDIVSFQLSAMTISPGKNEIVITAVKPNDADDSIPSDNAIIFTTYLDQSTDITPLRITLDNSSEVPWLLATAGDSKTWETVTTTKNQSLVYKAFSNPSVNDESWFVSPVLDFSTISKAALFYDVSYAQRLPNTDHLKVIYSTDCGVTYANTLLDASGSDLGTASSSTEWKPLSDGSWSKQYINVDDLTGKKNIRIAFVAVNGNGNDIYLDNIEIFANDANIPIVPQNHYQLYYPNTSLSDLALSFNLPARENVHLQIYNLMGQVVADNILPNTLNQTYYFDLSFQSQGLYIFKLQIGEQVSSTKVFIGH